MREITNSKAAYMELGGFFSQSVLIGITSIADSYQFVILRAIWQLADLVLEAIELAAGMGMQFEKTQDVELPIGHAVKAA